MLKTAAASVAETIAPSNIPSAIVKLKTRCTNTPTDNAVIKTPMVDKATPRHSTGFMNCQFVSSPPE